MNLKVLVNHLSKQPVLQTLQILVQVLWAGLCLVRSSGMLLRRGPVCESEKKIEIASGEGAQKNWALWFLNFCHLP